jgi:hypothetical protein
MPHPAITSVACRPPRHFRLASREELCCAAFCRKKEKPHEWEALRIKASPAAFVDVVYSHTRSR